VTGPATSVFKSLTPVATGSLWERYGYANDDPAVRFYLRKLQPTALTALTAPTAPTAPTASPTATLADAGPAEAGGAGGTAGSTVGYDDDYGPPQGKYWRVLKPSSQTLLSTPLLSHTLILTRFMFHAQASIGVWTWARSSCSGHL
jgi:hypothetical protein